MAAKAKAVFDFFGMPRELRDFVYDKSLTAKFELDRRGDAYEAGVFARWIPTTRLLLVSRQFNTELRERSTCFSVLTIEERLSETLSIDLTLTNHVALIPRLELKLSLQCGGDDHDGSAVHCSVESEIDMHAAWIKELIAQMVRLHSLSIELYISPCADVSTCEEQVLVHQSRLTGPGLITAFNVFHCDVGPEDFCYDRPKKLVMAWSEETKCLQRVERRTLQKAPTE